VSATGAEDRRTAHVSARGAARWAAGHPWIYRSDVRRPPDPERAGVVAVEGPDGVEIGVALWSPTSEIRLRRLDGPGARIDAAWWERRIGEASDRRGPVDGDAWRVVHGEADGLPSLVVDRYGPVVVAQLLSAGLEACRTEVLDAIETALRPSGILLRNDVSVRRHEELPLAVEPARGDVPASLLVREGPVRYRVDPWSGQKTGAFLDQRENRARAGALMAESLRRPGSGGPVRALDAFSFHGSFALHLAAAARGAVTDEAEVEIVAVDQSAEALARGRENAALNGLGGIRWVEGNAFDLLREEDVAGRSFDLVVLDPPAFAKRRGALEAALRGYGEINRRGIRLLRPGGRLLTFSCSFHVGRESFLRMLATAAADAGRRVALETVLGAAPDHPEVLTIPETGYLKGAVLRALDGDGTPP
jgi:23S rRNA (cytosine1962-C5)-methyltransferase